MVLFFRYIPFEKYPLLSLIASFLKNSYRFSGFVAFLVSPPSPPIEYNNLLRKPSRVRFALCVVKSHLQNVRGDIPRNPESLSMWIAAFLPFSSMEKYALLHETSTVARLLACEPHLVSLGGNAPRDSFPRTAAPAVSESHEHRLDGSDSAEEVYPSTPSSEER